MIGKSIVALTATLLLVVSAAAQPREDDYYRLIRFPMQDRLVLEVGALESLPNGKLAVATRRGEIYLLENPLTENLDELNWKLFASGLHEILGLAWRSNPAGGLPNDSLYC